MDRLNDSYFEDIEFEREEEKNKIGVGILFFKRYCRGTSTI
jgi:hypothetical protein